MNYNIFNSSIWKSKIDYTRKDELIKNLLEIYNENPNLLTPTWDCFVYSSFRKQDKGEIPEDLLDIIEKKIKQFLESCPDELKIKGTYILSEIWYNIYEDKHFQEPHIHEHSLFSGCYYLKFNKDIHHQTAFYNPNFDLDYSKLEDNSYFCFSPECDEDDIIIFPSSLKHGTKGVKKNCLEPRITISFNVINPDICFEQHKKRMPYK
jgi:uncharacterized protein (TIGR02466 family)